MNETKSPENVKKAKIRTSIAKIIIEIDVVRCKDCKHSYEDLGGRVCSHGVCADCAVAEDFFCAEGKRRDGDEKEVSEDG